MNNTLRILFFGKLNKTRSLHTNCIPYNNTSYFFTCFIIWKLSNTTKVKNANNKLQYAKEIKKLVEESNDVLFHEYEICS